MTLDQIVTDYTLRYQKRATKELRWFRIQRTLEETVRLAALAKGPSGKRLAHQRRIPETVLEQSRDLLVGCIPTIRLTPSFEDLHALVASAIDPVHGIGDLAVYDAALRIGTKLGLEPSVVFLHAGTREGAKRLGLNVSSGSIAVSDVPQLLRTLKPREIEDLLCIYKDQF
jgi:hypothetical protein